MAGINRKSRPKTAGISKTKKIAGKTKSTGPRLPAALRKELDTIKNRNLDDINSDDDDVLANGDEIGDSDIGETGNDFYEYEEEVAEEESRKNRRYDPVDNFEYQLPEKFKDEEISSEGDEDDEEHDQYSDDEERHARMLHNITTIPTEAFIGKKRMRKEVVSEAYPESEFNPSRDVLNGDGQITIQDLLAPLSDTRDFNKLRHKIQRVDQKGIKIHAPLPKPDRERLERSSAFDITRDRLTTTWERKVKTNRETPTLFFDNRKNGIKIPTVGTIASEFKPRTDFEKTIASLMHDEEIVEAYQNDGIKLLEMNKVSLEDVKDRQDKLAKMRSVLFRHEMKAKHIKKIKSKTYHRLKKKDKIKSSLDPLADPEATRELAEKQERKRIEARMTMKHKNQGKWARRIIGRGLAKQDEDTRASISEQLHYHNRLTRKMNSMKDSSSNEDSTDDDEDVNSSDEEGASKLLANAKEKTLRLMTEEDEVPDSGVFSLPFMVRGLEKRKEAANEEAKRALEEYDSLNQFDENAAKGLKPGTFSGKRVFGATQTNVVKPKKRHRPEVDNYGSENEDIIEESDGLVEVEGNHLHKDAEINLDVLREDLESAQKSTFECVDGITVEDPGSRTNYDVSVFAAGSWKKMKSVKSQRDTTLESNVKRITEVAKPSLYNDVEEDVAEDSDSDNEGQMVDGMLSSGPKQTYELPSNEELFLRAFAGDDVEEEFHKTKEDVLNEENPEPEKPLLLPGWGQWASVQKKKGIPSWMSKQHADAKQKREAALKKRKDAPFGHVIISEKIDKKAEKLYLKTLPYPFTSQEVFDQSIRNPLGPEFNPATIAGAITRPEVVKKSGVIIPPISFEEVDPHEKAEEKNHSKKRPSSNGKNSSKRSITSKRT